MPLPSFNKAKNRYQLKERLGTGGMGIVYRARDVVINADIALKTLSDITDPIALRMFREECDKLAKIVHPNVVEIRDVGEIEEHGARKPYMVMPFLRGKTLDKLLLDAPNGLPAERGLEILIQAARGLQATHEAGLVHRDVKPSNIFVLDDDSVRLIDFGVAHYAETLLTAARKGTLMYMAPEQVMMQGISPLSDIFSLGVVAYETLTGRRPFEGRTEKDLIENIVHRNPLPASRFNTELNLSIDKTLQKALAKLPEYRIRSAREFGEILRKAALNQPIPIFNGAQIDGPIEQARTAIARGDLDAAGNLLNQLELQGWLDERIIETKRDFEGLRNRRALTSFLGSARLRFDAQEYTLAAREIEEALRLEPRNTEAALLRKEIERARTERDLAERLTTARRLAGDREFGLAKEAVEQALEICPNDSAALELRSTIQQNEQDYSVVLNEKRRAIHRAELAMSHSDPERALETIQRALDLDRQAPESDESTSDLLNLSNRIVSISRDAQSSLERARDFFSSGDLDAALACCEKGLASLPEHAAFQALKLEIEEAQRERTARLIAATEQEIEADPDLDSRIQLLKSASERFSHVDERFGYSYRLACEKRDFVESLAAKARAAEQEHRPADALEAWNLVRSIHPGYPALDAEITRLKQSKDLQTDYECRQELLRQIRVAIEAREFAGALRSIHTSRAICERDPEFAELRAAAEAGSEREKLAGNLLDESAQLVQDCRYDDALRKLDEASTLDVRAREIIAARHHALVEQAQSLFDMDPRRAKTLLQRALELAPGRDATKKLLELLEERGRRERLSLATHRVRELERTHDLDGALRAAEQALAENPEDPELTQTAARLRRNRDRRVQAVEQPPSTSDTPGRAFLRAAWGKASALAHRSRPNFAPIRQRVMPSSSVRDEGTHGGGVAFAETTPSNAATPSGADAEMRPPTRGFRGVARKHDLFLVSVVLAGAVGIAILIAFVVPRRNAPVTIARHPQLAATHPPAAVPRIASAASVPLHLSPVDAQLMVDGSAASVRAGMLAVQPGTHVVEARSPGYEPFTRSIEISGNNNAPLDIALVSLRLPPTIHIETDLPSGSVLMDNRPAGMLEGGQFSGTAPEGPHIIAVLSPSGGRYSFAFTLGQNPVWSVEAPKSTAYGTPVLAALSTSGARILCGRPGIAFELDGGRSVACSPVGRILPALSKGNHTLTLLEGSRTIAVHTLDYEGAPLLAALVTTGAQFGGLAIQGTEDIFDVSVNGYTSKRPAKGAHWRRLLKAGDYTIAISKPGFQANPSTLNVSVAPGIDTLKQVFFTPLPQYAHLRLQSQPGTEVSLNGKLAGTVPESGALDVPQLAVGSTELHLHHNGFNDAQQTITLAKGDNQHTIMLKELKAKITVEVDPPDAQVVYSRGGSSLRQPVTDKTIEVPAGTYNFEASAPGHARTASIFSVSPGDTKTVSLRLDAIHPTDHNVDLWPGWAIESGWLVRDKPGPIFRSLPEHTSRIAFSARWERQKTLVHWSAGSLNLVFRTADHARTVAFRITEHGVSWSVTGQAQRQDGKLPLNLANDPETIQADIRASGISLTINGTTLVGVGPNLSTESKPLQFGFIIDQDEIVRLMGIRVRVQPAGTN